EYVVESSCEGMLYRSFLMLIQSPVCTCLFLAVDEWFSDLLRCSLGHQDPKRTHH
ncbi:hypothetical protein FRC20_003741, partial [Serendipita sp. 405]